MHYKGGGRALDMGYFGPGDGKIYVTKIKCSGNESSIMKCQVIFKPDGFKQGSPRKAIGTRYGYYRMAVDRYSSCWSHNDDAAIQCYESGLQQT